MVLATILGSTLLAAIVSAGVSAWVAIHTSNKRLGTIDLPDLQLRQQRWKHERTSPKRDAERATLTDVLAALSSMAAYLTSRRVAHDEATVVKARQAELVEAATKAIDKFRVGRFGQTTTVNTAQRAVAAFDAACAAHLAGADAQQHEAEFRGTQHHVISGMGFWLGTLDSEDEEDFPTAD